MKLISLLIILLFCFSCRKDDTSFIQFVIGETDQLKVTEHNLIIPSTPLVSGELMINLDGEGEYDILVKNRTSQYSTLKPDTVYSAWIETLDERFSIAEIRNSGIIYQNPMIIHDFYGTFPRETHEWIRTCEPWLNAITDTTSATAQPFQHGDKMIDNLYWDNLNDRVNLVASPVIDYNYEFNETGDSLVGYQYVSDGTCPEIVSGPIFYLVFKKENYYSGIKYGWIELKITDHNSIHVLRSAIQS